MQPLPDTPRLGASGFRPSAVWSGGARSLRSVRGRARRAEGASARLAPEEVSRAPDHPLSSSGTARGRPETLEDRT